MKVVFHEDFKKVYTSDPASAPGRMEAVLNSLKDSVTYVHPFPASFDDIARVHTRSHIEYVERIGLYEISALSAGGAIKAARIGIEEPSFGLIRPPGHHASRGSSWGFCYFNNMAIAIEWLKKEGIIRSAFILDIDLHFGDGTVNIFEGKDYVSIYNPQSHDRKGYLDEVKKVLPKEGVEIIGISAGFDNHIEDWGGLLFTEDYREIGKMARQSAMKSSAGLFAILEGGYNHSVLGENVRALIEGMQEA
jgi:acetoin utilization deacetylase AcuC-like enzyme